MKKITQPEWVLRQDTFDEDLTNPLPFKEIEKIYNNLKDKGIGDIKIYLHNFDPKNYPREEKSND